MNKPFLITASLVVVIAGAAILTSRAFATPPSPQSKNAFNTTPVGAIAPWDAMKLAAKASGGKPIQALYEFDDGKWGYAVMVAKGHKLYEVEIDPVSGKVGDVESVSLDGEAKEMKSDLAAALKAAG